MRLAAFLLSHHVASMVGGALTVAFVASVLRQRRPAGSAMAWILAIVLVPYVGIPLYLVLGGRKFKRRADSKPRLRLPHEPSAAGGLLVSPGTPQEHASRLEWLEDGVVAYEALLREIRAARSSIRIMTFVVGNDDAGRTIIGELTRRASEGIEVRLLIDDLLRYRAPREHLARLEAAGGRVHRFMPLVHVPFRGRSNLRNHRKIALFDGQRALVGGMNLADEYMGPRPNAERWRDLSVVVSGSCVTTLDAVFRSDWLFAAGEVLESPIAGDDGAPGAIPVHVVPSGPDDPGDAIYDALLQAVFAATHRVWIATPYFAPDESLAKALEIAVRRGVDVRVIVPERSNHGLADVVGGAILRDLSEAGVRVFHFGPSMLHAKALLVDDALATIGSANFDMRSLFLDYEVALLFTGEQEVARLTAWFEQTLVQAPEGAPATSWLRSQLEPWARLVAPLV